VDVEEEVRIARLGDGVWIWDFPTHWIAIIFDGRPHALCFVFVNCFKRYVMCDRSIYSLSWNKSKPRDSSLASFACVHSPPT
jgi:hypothetical protein